MKSGGINTITNEKGVLTLDYLFALTLVLGFTTILFALSITLVVAEITQYMTFASARAYSSGHHSEVQQEDLGTKKYSELYNHTVLKSFFKNGWFEVTQATPGNLTNQGFPVQNAKLHYFTGVKVRFNSKILDFKIPFYGSTSDETSGGKEKGFTTSISAMIIREPTSQECIHTIRQRWKFIQSLSGSYGQYGTKDNTLIVDNGC